MNEAVAHAQTNTQSEKTHSPSHSSNKKLLVMAFAALGVVFGDIGTSPLYAINQIFFGHGNTAPTSDNVYGAISLVVWALTLIVTIKYLIFVTRADNDGEGGVFSLYSLLNKHKKWGIPILMLLLTLSAGLLFGDGLITPAISVLSAVEGLNVATPFFQPYVIPITIAILVGLFAIQHKGTAKVGNIFGPIVTVWFIVIGSLGVSQIVHHPEIFKAFNPLYGIEFLQHAGLVGTFLVLGSVMLAVTGGEALYADMGHFGKKPIRLGWFALVYPALLLNYLGQGAFLLSNNTVVNNNIFYSMVPSWGLYPMVILAMAATIIASQALISGVFSLTTQAIALQVFPRLKITHTHKDHEGQVYIGFINWALCIGCILLVLGFKSSDALASAYGLAVSGDMLTTSLSMLAISKYLWKWKTPKVFFIFGGFALIDCLFLTSNSLKFFEGGFIPLSIGLVLFGIMVTWKWGRKTTFHAYSKQHTMTMKELIQIKKTAPDEFNRTVLLFAPKPLQSEEDNTPALLELFWNRYGMLPKNLIFVDIIQKKDPYIYENRCDVRVFYKDVEQGSIASVSIKFGFMEEPNVEKVLEELAKHKKIDLHEDPRTWLIHVSIENLIHTHKTNLFRRLRLTLFLLLRRISQPSYYYYGLGNKVHLSTEIMPVEIH